jgi:hypothetical protein
MRRNNQTYWLVFHARPDAEVSADDKFSCFLKGIKEVAVPWRLGDQPIPSAEKLKRKGGGVIGFPKFFGEGVKRAMMTLEYRQMLEDKDSCDDVLNITFDPAKADVRYLIYTVIPKYIKAFNAYLVEYFDDKFIDLAWNVPPEQRFYADRRFNVNRVDVVSFYDELLCHRAFKLTPEKIVERFQGKIELAELLDKGVYLVGTSRVLPFDEATKLCREMTNVLLS